MSKPSKVTAKKYVQKGLDQLPPDGISRLLTKIETNARIILDGAIVRGCGKLKAG